VRGDPASEAGTERQRGYVEALARWGVEPEASLTAGASFELAGGLEATRALLARRERPTAVFFASDELALGGLRVIKDHGLAVPDDVSVVSINDIPFAAADPPLTTVHMPAREMDMLAMQALLEIVHGRQPPRDVVLSVELVVRRSASPPRGAPPRRGARR
jgi:DNA-binding LacI/PurR family transcriptional regulator